MKTIKLFALLPLLFTPLMMTGCQANSNVKTIGICQFVAHPALDAATEGFKAAVEEGLGKANVKFDVKFDIESDVRDRFAEKEETHYIQLLINMELL